jgi:hypothetical protein
LLLYNPAYWKNVCQLIDSIIQVRIRIIYFWEQFIKSKEIAHKIVSLVYLGQGACEGFIYEKVIGPNDAK